MNISIKRNIVAINEADINSTHIYVDNVEFPVYEQINIEAYVEIPRFEDKFYIYRAYLVKYPLLTDLK